MVPYLFLFFSGALWGQDLTVQSLFPESAFVTGRLLPFAVGSGTEHRVTRIRMLRGDSCDGLIDPYRPHHFHLVCLQPTTLEAEVIVRRSNGDNVHLLVGPLPINQINSPGSSQVQAFDRNGE